MKVLSFDLSSACVGVIAAHINDYKELTLMRSAPIIPPKLDASNLGFMKSKKKLPTPTGKKQLNTWAYKGENSILEKEKKRRDVLVRDTRNKFILEGISASIGNMVNTIQPNLVLVERNEVFNGILTIELLAKVTGILVGIVAEKGIPMLDYNVQTVRKRYEPAKLVKEFAAKYSSEYIQKLPDVTKAALREVMQTKYEKYGLILHTDDESDACVVFDYWYEEIFLKEV